MVRHFLYLTSPPHLPLGAAVHTAGVQLLLHSRLHAGDGDEGGGSRLATLPQGQVSMLRPNPAYCAGNRFAVKVMHTSSLDIVF